MAMLWGLPSSPGRDTFSMLEWPADEPLFRVDRCNRRTRNSQGLQCLDTTVGSKMEIGKGFNTSQEALRLNKSRTTFL